MTRSVMPDANILMALDPLATTDKAKKLEALSKLEALLNDPDVRLIINPLLKYEVLCGIADEQQRAELSGYLDQITLMEDINAAVSDLAVSIYRASAERNIRLKNPDAPGRYKFDLFHFAFAALNQLEIETLDRSFQTYKDLHPDPGAYKP